MVNFETANEINKISAKKYKQGFVTELETERAEKGLSESTIRFISRKKNEPVWMLEWRLKAFKIWQKLNFESQSIHSNYHALMHRLIT